MKLIQLRPHAKPKDPICTPNGEIYSTPYNRKCTMVIVMLIVQFIGQIYLKIKLGMKVYKLKYMSCLLDFGSYYGFSSFHEVVTRINYILSRLNIKHWI